MGSHGVQSNWFDEEVCHGSETHRISDDDTVTDIDDTSA
jgi:hypothetical protein